MPSCSKRGRQVERKAEVDAQGVSTLLEARLTGMLRMRATQDGVERIHGFHRLGDYPPYVIAGLAAYPEHGKTPDDLIRCADQALYKVKHEGRNRGSIYSD